MIKTRFAPSPTGQLHVGNVRTALFAYLYAKHTDGNFVLRIEDTDQERSLPEYTTRLMEDLKWLGIDWDEGPQPDGKETGENGPYKQSERLDIYNKYIEKLIEEGRAYYCYCSPEELDERKKALQAAGKPPHYDRKCLNLDPAELDKFEKEGRVPVVRFRVYEEEFLFDDAVKGEVKFPEGMVGDFVIRRSNGLPTYNFAVVVDDALMEITHVLRADEHLSNTVRQLMIYRALGFEAPKFAHMSLVMGQDNKKLSKRHGATSVAEFREMGYLPEAMVNYLSLLGWSSPDGEEILSKEGLIKRFDLDRLSSSPAIFDNKKLNWMAKHYVMNADAEKIYSMAKPYILNMGLVDEKYLKQNDEFMRGVVEMTRGYCSHLSEITDYIDYFLRDDYPISDEAMKFLRKDGAKNVLEGFLAMVEAAGSPIDEAFFNKMTDQLKESTGLKGKHLFMPLRAALTGRTRGPEIYFLMPIIGNERTAERIKRVLEMI